MTLTTRQSEPDIAANELLPAATPIQLLSPSGGLTDPHPMYPVPPTSVLCDTYRRMVMGRRLDAQATALSRQGRLAVYPSSRGQEACQAVAAQVLREQDWLFPTYRDSMAVISRGVPAQEALTAFAGSWHCGYDPARWRTAPHCTPLATQILHAAGCAHGLARRGANAVCLALIGDGGTSEGDFHEGLNFAAVFCTPAVFLVQNNRYAISVPVSRQSVAPSFAHKGVGYGIPSEQVDGNDPVAMLAVMSAAVDYARLRGSPVLIEAHTYRLDGHHSGDDHRRYRAVDEVETWRARDPVARLERYLRGVGALDDDLIASIVADAESGAAELRMSLSQRRPVDPLELFDHVFAELTPQLLGQRQQVLSAELEAPRIPMPRRAAVAAERPGEACPATG